MGNRASGNNLDSLRDSLAPQQNYQPGIISSMLSRGEDPNTLPKKSFLGGKGWEPPSPTWSPWDMWSKGDVNEGMANANRSLSEAIAAKDSAGSMAPPSARPAPSRMIQGEPSIQPVAPSSPMQQLPSQPISRPGPGQHIRKQKKNKAFNQPAQIAPKSMPMY